MAQASTSRPTTSGSPTTSSASSRAGSSASPTWSRRRTRAIPFKCLSRADLLLRGDAVDALKRAGAQTVWVGAESGSQKILDAMEKGTQVEQIYEAARRLHAAGIEVGFFLQFGYPGETREDIEQTLQMVRDCRPDDIGMSVSYPLPGTQVPRRGAATSSASSRTGSTPTTWRCSTRAPTRPPFYRQLHRVLHNEFRARKNREALTQVARRPTTARRAHLRQAAAMTAQLTSLPLERRRLDQLAKQQPESRIRPLPMAFDPAASARPTPQTEA